jgi:hypothetical protein
MCQPRSPPRACQSVQRRAERRPGVAGRRLHPDPLEQARVADARVHHAVERDAAGEAKVLRSRFPLQPAGQFDGGFLEHPLQRARDVGMLLRQRRTALARGAEALRQVRLGNLVSAIAVDPHEVAEFLLEDRIAVGSKRHDLVFVG